jgi:hypothetical protein
VDQLVLDLKQVPDMHFGCVGPQKRTRRSVGELAADADAVTGTNQRASDDHVHVRFRTDPSRIQPVAAEA